MNKTKLKSMTYRDAGVNIEVGDSMVDIIKPMAARTHRNDVLAGIGGFGAMFQIPKKFHEPVLVSGTDGVGTKLRLAFQLNKHNTIGIDLVAMSVNDILVQGAEPLFFLDYFACGNLDINIAKNVIDGISYGCQLAGCALIGGETAEMPSMYIEGEYDLAGFAVGAVEKNSIINGNSIKNGDLIIGISSSGAHSNGYSLIRKIIDNANIDIYEDFYGKPLHEVIMEPTRIYVKPILSLIEKFSNKVIKGLAHITGGGLSGNIPRILKNQLSAEIYRDSWKIPPLFTFLQQKGNVEDDEMFNVFNCGIGMIIVIEPDMQSEVINFLSENGENAMVIGKIIETNNNSKINIL
ncbi:Phosphoribosylformylglycinamidine cyclo-ligase [Candidatus Kinetoplastibacterium sorsogonicusi]|uniref:Phosphoribosylformylglycinamidine cyclo-ligase n=1 Tax=Candidatus Kinetoplastidibacterium kentomonadis TaxID=1576550 RepID=A0A3Q8ERM6_9PROT|nr:phosphoribosylformylglycinamidine cyclo-ligase [Candidatus Kinetoplastibacterium sorsogonicusi]AWD32645.1 Phosphoribosylformylglycinamidine cyclo-ligase [Candidatus Kinetoplastibacterium sorsogonicusi]